MIETKTEHYGCSVTYTNDPSVKPKINGREFEDLRKHIKRQVLSLICTLSQIDYAYANELADKIHELDEKLS